MKLAANHEVTLVEVLELTRPYAEFVGAVQAVARRLEVEGIQELVRVQFYANPDSREAGALLTFADHDQVNNHMNLVGHWAEFQHFITTMKPIDVRVYGQLSSEAEAWIRQFIPISKAFVHHVAGFVRYTEALH